MTLQGYHLVVATHNEHTFLQLSMVKSCLACNPTFCYAERILLQADDRLLFMSYKGSIPGQVEWKHLHIPHTYLAFCFVMFSPFFDCVYILSR